MIRTATVQIGEKSKLVEEFTVGQLERAMPLIQQFRSTDLTLQYGAMIDLLQFVIGEEWMVREQRATIQEIRGEFEKVMEISGFRARATPEAGGVPQPGEVGATVSLT